MCFVCFVDFRYDFQDVYIRSMQWMLYKTVPDTRILFVRLNMAVFGRSPGKLLIMITPGKADVEVCPHVRSIIRYNSVNNMAVSIGLDSVKSAYNARIQMT